ncbi:MAG: redoxin domain-containing protein [Planctomycetota bacterium]|nr:MAG: redoxin domain-containing protein [Planctomycetota bacterium]
MGRAWTLLGLVGIGWNSPPTTRPEYQVVTMLQWAPAPAIAKELRRIDPAADDWEAEVFAVAAYRTLDALRPALVGHAPAASIGFDGPVTVPAAGSLLLRYTDGNVDVRGWNSANGGPVERRSGIEGLRQLLALAGDPRDAQITFEMTRIAIDGAAVATEVLTRITGTLGQVQRVQQNARLRIDWTWRPADDMASLVEVNLVSLEQTTAARPLFTDCTSDMLGSDLELRTQLLYGPEHWLTHLDRPVQPGMVGGNGIAVGDIDGDGLDDVFVCRIAGLPNLLLRQNADGSVTEIGSQAGVDYLDETSGALLVDIDNDGDQDLLAAMNNKLIVMYNNGEARFAPGVRLTAAGPGPITSVVAADYDLDGDLDIYACRYSSISEFGGMTLPIPYHDANNGPNNLLWRNDGERMFTDVTVEIGLDANNRRFSYAACWEDYDLDGDVDLYVANDFGKNNLYRNDDGVFVDVAAEAGAEDMAAGMGVTWADYDLDGDLDIYISNMYSPDGERITRQDGYKNEAHGEVLAAYRRHARGNTLLANNGDGTFEDVSEAAGVARGYWAWGATFVDFNNDGREDLYVPNGYLSKVGSTSDLQSFFWRRVVNVAPLDPNGWSQTYADAGQALRARLRGGMSWAGFEPNLAYINCADGGFADISFPGNVDFRDDGRAVALVDWDGDGDLDMWLRNRTGPQLRFMRNNVGADKHAIAFRLVGVQCNRDGIGARVELTANGKRLMKTLHAGSGYIAQSSKWIHFGLGEAESASDIVVHWPGGRKQRFDHLLADTRYIVHQDKGIAPTAPREHTAIASMGESNWSQAARDDARIVLIEPLTVRGVELTDLDGVRHRLADHAGKPVLVVAWTNNSSHSRELLSMLADIDRNELGFEVLAIAGHPAADLPFAKQLRAPYPVGTADRATWGRLLLLKHAIYQATRGEITLPTSFLIDPRGRIRVLYIGPVESEQLAGDVKAVATDQSLAQSLSGRWVQRPVRRLNALARWFADIGMTEDARAYLQEMRGGSP